MKASLCVLVIVLLLEGVFCYIAREQFPPSPDYPNRCYNPKTKEAHVPGEIWYNPYRYGGCAMNSCLKGDDYYLVYTVGCETVENPNPPFKIVQDRTKRYPACCPQITWDMAL